MKEKDGGCEKVPEEPTDDVAATTSATEDDHSSRSDSCKRRGSCKEVVAVDLPAQTTPSVAAPVPMAEKAERRSQNTRRRKWLQRPEDKKNEVPVLVAEV
uniref:(northern house mosquito) hypothetical protein n=1 Tax=Culex pipiens TaxID=7175 RepID=A0A8D8AT95_CULPI